MNYIFAETVRGGGGAAAAPPLPLPLRDGGGSGLVVKLVPSQQVLGARRGDDVTVIKETALRLPGSRQR